MTDPDFDLARFIAPVSARWLPDPEAVVERIKACAQDPSWRAGIEEWVDAERIEELTAQDVIDERARRMHKVLTNCQLSDPVVSELAANAEVATIIGGARMMLAVSDDDSRPDLLREFDGFIGEQTMNGTLEPFAMRVAELAESHHMEAVVHLLAAELDP
jgi:hypothetical protein